MSKKIFVIHGPNLNLLGQREVSIYGKETLEDINKKIKAKAKELGFSIDCWQSNSEGEIINKIHSLKSEKFDALIINPGAYTHTSVAIRDAISSVEIQTLEVHLSNIHAREEFRKTSLIAPVCIGQITGFGSKSYLMALAYFL